MVLVVGTKMRVTAKEQYAKIEFGIFSGILLGVYNIWVK